MLTQTAPAADAASIRAHLNHITARWSEIGQPCLLELVYLTAEDAAKVYQVSHYKPEDIELAVQDCLKFNQHRLNGYATVNPVDGNNRPSAGKRASAGHILGSFFHWADADDETAAANIKNFVGPKPNFVVLTGTQPSARPHVYWELEDFTRNMSAWSDIQRNIAGTLKSDPVVIDPPRIMRVAGTVNWPKPQKQAKGYIPETVGLHIHDEDTRPHVTSEQMARAFAGGADPKATDQPSSMFATNLPPEGKDAAEYADILRRARTDGEKHGGVRDLAAHLAGSGVARHMAEAIIREACPVWDDGVEALIATAYAKFAPDAKFVLSTPDSVTKPENNVTNGVEWFDDIEPALTDSYLVKAVLASDTMSVVYGPSNSGKTFFALDLAFHIAAGMEWRGHRVKQAAVLYLAAEGGRGVANRIVALREANGIHDIPLALRRAGMDLLNEGADIQTVYDLAMAVKARAEGLPLIIVIDTLSRVMAGGDENNASDMTALIRNIDQIRAASNAHIMLVHHTGKDVARGARGHSSLRAATDTEIEVQTSEDEDGAPHRAAMVTKQRDYNGGETFAFSLKTVVLGVDQDGDEVTSCIVEGADAEEFRAAKKAKKGRGKHQQTIMETFDQMVAEDKANGCARGNPGGPTMPEPGTYWVVESDELRRLSQGKMVGTDTGRLFRQAWEALTVKGGLFVAADNLAWRIDRKKNK